MNENYIKFFILEYSRDIQRFMTHFWIHNKHLIEMKYEDGKPYLEIPEPLFNYIDTMSLDQIQKMINTNYNKRNEDFK